MKLERWAASVAAVLLLAGLVWWSLTPPVPNPVYKGKRLSYWLEQLPMTAVLAPSPTNGPFLVGWMSTTNRFSAKARHQPVEKSEDAMNAIRALGTNALPMATARFMAHDSRFKKLIPIWLNKLGIRRGFLETQEVDRGRAATALLCLQPLPDVTTALLQPLATNSDSTIATLSRVIMDYQHGRVINNQTNITTIVVLPGR